jgi:hypothetical protein
VQLKIVKAALTSSEQKFKSQWGEVGKKLERMVLTEEALFKSHLMQQAISDINFTKDTEIRSFVSVHTQSTVELGMMSLIPPDNPADFVNLANEIQNFTDRFINLKTLPAPGDREINSCLYYARSLIQVFCRIEGLFCLLPA